MGRYREARDGKAMVNRQTEQCKATTAAGTPCSAQPVQPSGWCYWHDPTLAADRAEARRKGGANKSNRVRAKKALPADPMTALELESWLGIVFRKLITGSLEPGVATAAASVAKAMVVVKEAGAVDALAEEVATLRVEINRRRIA